MKKYAVILVVLLFVFQSSIIIHAAGATAPPKVPFLTGSTVNIPYDTSSTDADRFFNSYGYVDGRSYFVATSRYLDYAMKNVPAVVEDETGDYSYLHFITISGPGDSFEFFNTSGSACPVGVKYTTSSSNDTSYLRVLTYRYDSMTGSFDNGTLRDVRSILFDYAIDGGVFSGQSYMYPPYGYLGKVPMVGTYNTGYDWWIGQLNVTDNSHKLTVSYLHEDGSEAFKSFVQTYNTGSTYKVTSPQIYGYSPDQFYVTGKMPSHDLSIRITYKKTFHPDPTKKELRIQYRYEDGSTAAPDYVDNIFPSYPYDVVSPKISGFATDKLRVSGYMSTVPLLIRVVYFRSGNVSPSNYYTLTVEYLYSDGQTIHPSSVQMVHHGRGYAVTSPEIKGFTSSKGIVTGIMPENHLTLQVYYYEDDSGGGSGEDSSSEDSSGGSSSGGSSSGGSSSGGSSSGGSSSGGSSSGGSSSGGSSSGGSSSGGSGSGGWNPPNVDLDNLFPNKPKPDFGDFIFNLFNPFGYNNYKPPVEVPYDPLDGYDTNVKMPTFPDLKMPDFSDPFDKPISPDFSDPFDKPISPDFSDPFDRPISPNFSDPFDRPISPDFLDPFDRSIAPDFSDPFDRPISPDFDDPFDNIVIPDFKDPFDFVIKPNAEGEWSVEANR